jgi:hypothetical protein
MDDAPIVPLVPAPTTQQQLASCAVSEHVFGWELSPEARTGRLVEKTASFAESGHDFLEMVKDIVTDERYRRIK